MEANMRPEEYLHVSTNQSLLLSLRSTRINLACKSLFYTGLYRMCIINMLLIAFLF